MSPSEQATRKPDGQHATVKPGAAIEFTSEIDGTLSVGSFTDVVLRLSPGYNSGTMQASAKGTSGLEVLQSSASLNHDMSTGAAVWRVAVRPLDDGKHYLNIMAMTFGGEVQEERARVFSVPLDLGGKTVSDTAEKANIIDDESGKLIVMDAEETISSDD